MFILRWAGVLFSCHVAFSSVSVEARSVRRSNVEVYRRLDNDTPAPLGQQQANPGTYPTRSRLSTEIIVRRYVVFDGDPADHVAESNRVLTLRDPIDYLIAAERGPVSAVSSTSPCPTTSAPPKSTMGMQVSCTNLFVQCKSAPVSTKGRDIAIVVAVFLFLCLIVIVFLVRHVRGKMANAGDAETTSKPGEVTPYIVPPSANDTSLPTYHSSQGNLGQVGSQRRPLRVPGGGRTKLASFQPPAVVTPSSATRPSVPTDESDGQLSRSNGGQGHIHQQQRELDDRLRVVQQEMMILQANLSTAQSRRINQITREHRNAGNDTESDMTMREVCEVIRELEDQIACLQDQHGLVLGSNEVVEPPPVYQPSPLTQSIERPGENT